LATDVPFTLTALHGDPVPITISEELIARHWGMPPVIGKLKEPCTLVIPCIVIFPVKLLAAAFR
jgi:hypothetical protein